MTHSSHPAFECLRRETIPSLNLEVEEYRHRKTGAQHIHLNTDNDENVFLVALRTVPHDSTGVAHILEHTALCGSKKYPVRDPFFMMIRRSLNTFMNAFTSSDWTAYPFASQNKKDFNNLLDVYLDAVFFSRLDPLDFAQEGHRVEFSEADNPNSELVFKGVVFNEMKGAMSSVPSQLWQTLCKYLFPTSTYHHNSGGEPDCIPDLSYEELQAFYKTHYHPSNATFMTFGDIPAHEHQANFEEKALKQFDALADTIAVTDEKRYLAPVRVEEYYPIDEESGTEQQTHIVMGWLLGQSTDLAATLRAHLLSAVLLDNSASPLQKFLETTQLGQSPSPLCGLEDSQKELSFICGIEGSDADKADQFEQEILATLRDVAENGVPQSHIEAALHQLELQQREIGGDSYPYGLQLIMNGLTAATHRGDVIGLLSLDKELTQLREEIQDPQFIPNLINNVLLNNQHRVRLVLRPDTDLSERKQTAEKQRLAAIKNTLSDSDSQQIIELAQALKERQEQQDDFSILPKVGLDDVQKAMSYLPADNDQYDFPLTSYSVGTNGLVYQQMVIDLPTLSDAHMAVLPYYSACITELGLGDDDYLTIQQRQAEVVGSISASTTLRGQPNNEQNVAARLTLSAKALTQHYSAMCNLLDDTLQKARFDEHERIKDLMTQIKSRRESSITGNGHGLAMTAACAGMSPAAKLTHELSGLGGIQHIKTLVNGFSEDTNLHAFCQQLQELHNIIKASSRRYLLVGEAEHKATYVEQLQQCFTTPNTSEQQAFTLPAVRETQRSAWLANTQVNFCAKAYPTVTMEHPDAAALTVLGGFLRNGYLHRTIREQGGAYGGGASQDSNIAAFRFFSYRDPRLTDTLKDFDASVQWLLNTEHDAASLEEAILGVVSSIDKPSSPAGEAKQTYHAELFGRTKEKREQLRQRVLVVTIEDLQRVASTYLTADNASLGIVSNAEHSEELAALNLPIHTL